MHGKLNVTTDSVGRCVEPNERKKPAYQRSYVDLRSALDEGHFADGERMPTEAELAQTHGVGRQTVRRVFQDLASRAFG